MEGSLYLIQSEDITLDRRKLEDYETTEDLNYSQINKQAEMKQEEVIHIWKKKC
ncbi:hypothetical protein HPL003_27120 [Paenibacillus terrae HPL-003]|uniref:Uncharacterized protein n=1 Tax=Paenibacillus terrae (strain HPL-003) TaxID=985665 RepID=G7VSC7_PAETH|nr:hypothetical protein HPL003_27120 [Paenibacillus terrae HPL-003]